MCPAPSLRWASMDDLHTAPRSTAGREPLAEGVPGIEAAGQGQSPALPLPPARRFPGMRPAMVVVGLAGLLVVGLIVTGALSGPGHRASPIRKGLLGPVRGTSLRAVAASGPLRPIEQDGQPPTNIVRTLTLPAGAHVVSVADNTGTDQYDEQMQFALDASEADVLAFYKTELAHGGWRVLSSGPATNLPGGVEVLGELGGSDGWYWEVGAVVSPTTFPAGTSGTTGTSGSTGTSGTTGTTGSTAPSASAPAGAESTRFTLRLFQVADEN